MNDRLDYALRLADDSLIAAQRLCECITASPQLEEDVAAANIALDLLGQARAFYGYAQEAHPEHPSEDDFAYRRGEREFTNALLVELPNLDFAHTVVRGLIFAGYQSSLYQGLASSCDAALAAIAVKSNREVAYHFRHFSAWLVRLGAGTAESHQRAEPALAAIWPYSHELLAADRLTDALAAAGIGADPADIRAGFDARVPAVIEQAGLAIPEGSWRPSGGRAGRHTEDFGYLLAEMQSLARAHPGVTW